MGKTTNNLKEQLQNTNNIQNFLNSNKAHLINRDLSSYLQKLLIEKKMKKSDVINKANLNISYGYDIFSQGKNPSRDKLLMLCFGFELDSDEANHLLNHASVGELYPRIPRDSIIIFCLNKKKSLLKCNLLLESLGETILE